MKKILLTFSSFCLLIASTACRGNNPIPSVSPSPTGEPSESVLLRSKKESTSYNDSEIDEGFVDFYDKYLDFSYRLSGELTFGNYKKNENLVISPLSIYMALAMSGECSKGNTRNEILNALGMSYEQMSEYTSLLYRLSTKSYKDDNDSYMGIEKLSNSIWFSSNRTIIEEGLNSLSDKYYVDSFQADFFNNNAQANKDFSGYIKKETNNLIDKQYNFGRDTNFLLANVLYLKDVWNEHDGLSYADSNYTFTDINGNVSNEKLLKSRYALGRAYQNETFRTFSAYTNRYFSVQFVVPQDGVQLSSLLDKEIIKEALTVRYVTEDDELMERYHTSCIFKPFEGGSDLEIKDTLSNKFGIKDLFTSKCDMSNITNTPSYCSDVLHTTKVKVDKKGIEGAAVTVMSYPGAAQPIEVEYKDVYEIFHVDRAFMYVIKDHFGIPLFVGVVNK